MPRLSCVLSSTSPFKKFSNYKPIGYKYKIVLPPVLRDYVSNKSNKLSSAYCVEEMSVMMACWKRNDFNQQRCSQELSAFHKCAVAAQAAEKAAREAAKAGKVLDNTGRYPSHQVNKLLQRYPQPPTTIRLKWSVWTFSYRAVWAHTVVSVDKEGRVILGLLFAVDRSVCTSSWVRTHLFHLSDLENKNCSSFEIMTCMRGEPKSS